ncbi:MAG: family transcriptional regulator [Hyphomicrobiales bacterium]|nr:family transcriptional regulator [Hyphomicrobiales bacterium]
MADPFIYPETMIHPESGALLSRRRRKETVTYMGYSREIMVEGYFPEDDGDGVIMGSDHEVFDAALDEMKERFAEDTKRLAKGLRTATRLTQKEASLLLTGSPNSFSKYERGEAQPSWPTFVLLKLIAADPTLIDKIKAA